jgi:hypothetical protein
MRLLRDLIRSTILRWLPKEISCFEGDIEMYCELWIEEIKPIIDSKVRELMLMWSGWEFLEWVHLWICPGTQTGLPVTWRLFKDGIKLRFSREMNGKSKVTKVRSNDRRSNQVVKLFCWFGPSLNLSWHANWKPSYVTPVQRGRFRQAVWRLIKHGMWLSRIVSILCKYMRIKTRISSLSTAWKRCYTTLCLWHWPLGETTQRSYFL